MQDVFKNQIIIPISELCGSGDNFFNVYHFEQIMFVREQDWIFSISTLQQETVRILFVH